MQSIPLVVDLDGTLLRSDVLIETGFSFIKDKPLRFFEPIFWLMSGKASLKDRLSKEANLDVTVLPYDQQVLKLIEEEKKKGRKIILATASHKLYADKIANYLGIFDDVMATEEGVNLSGSQKGDALVNEFGVKGFDYVGNSGSDIPVWRMANRSYVVNPELGVEAKAKSLGNVERVINTSGNLFKAWAKALRFHQWVKNLLLFVPLLASHQLGDIELFINGLIAFVCFGVCASSVYLLNDLLDLEDDRHHSSKRFRPFASGDLSLKAGLIAVPLLLMGAFTCSLTLLPSEFNLTIAVYYILTLAYSVLLKRKMVIDVITLALLYTLRIIAGTFAFDVSLTFWMLAFSMFIFLSLALVKRYAELMEARNDGRMEKTRGRDYYPSDLEMVSSLGAASGYISVMILALYIQDQTTIALYSRPQVIWLACPILLFWISRIWLLTHRGQMHDDPIVFAIKDRMSLIVGLLFGVIFWIAT